MAVTPSIIDGFEHGLASSALYDAVSNASNVTTPVRTGNRALRLNPSAAAARVGYTLSSTIVASAFYVRFATLPGDNGEVALFTTPAGTVTIRYDTTSGKLEPVVGGNVGTVGGPVLATGQWYRVVMEYDGTVVNTPRLRVSVDGGTEIDHNPSGISSGAAASARLGNNASSTMDAYYDDWVVSVTDGDYEQMRDDWVSHKVEPLLPTGDGSHSISGANLFERTATGTDITNSTTDAYLLVDDVPLDTAGTDYVNQVGSAANDYVEVTLSNLAAGTDTPVAVRMYGTDSESSGTGSTPSRSYAVLADGTAVTPDLKLSTDDPGVTVATRKKLLNAPSGGWDRTKVDGLKVRMGHGDGAPDSFFESFVLEAALYEPVAASGAQFISIIVGL